MLVPARHQRSAGGDACGRRICFAFNFGVGDDAIDQALGRRLLCAEDTAFEQNFQHDGTTGDGQHTL